LKYWLARALEIGVPIDFATFFAMQREYVAVQQSR
jgi:hypothetical protein